MPGHTPAGVAYLIADAAFVGDTLVMQDYGTARADFPSGDAHALYRSIRRLLELPDTTRFFLCHDYKAIGRDGYRGETTVGEPRQSSIHIHDGVSEDAFVAMREKRDAGLNVPNSCFLQSKSTFALATLMRQKRMVSPICAFQ